MRSVDLLLSLLYPPRCPACDRALRAPRQPQLCRSCRAALTLLRDIDACPRCSEPGSSRLCARCCSEAPPFARARACVVYRDDDLSSHLLQRWKYGGDHVVGAAIAMLLAEHRRAHAECYDVVVPVPLHSSRLAHRGFNQSATLARALARRHEHIAVDALQRGVTTASQAALGRRARQENVRDAFAARANARLTGRSVLLVDDVVTTGATVRACSTALLAAGASRVDVWTFARTPPRAAASRARP